jgi:hypothetical protein
VSSERERERERERSFGGLARVGAGGERQKDGMVIQALRGKI